MKEEMMSTASELEGSSPIGCADVVKKPSQENFTTVVFVHMTEAQRQELMSYVHSKWGVEDGLRVTAVSSDHEMTRINLIEEALDRFDDHCDLRDVIGSLCSHPDVSAWDWEKAFEDA